MALSIERLTAWLSAIMQRSETTHPETNWNLLSALGDVLAFPALIAPDNDVDQSDSLRQDDDPDGAEGE